MTFDYKIVCDNDPTVFSKKVTALLTDGYELVGSLCQNNGVHSQGLIKHTPEPAKESLSKDKSAKVDAPTKSKRWI